MSGTFYKAKCNTVYMWKVVGKALRGKQLYKIGKTHSCRGLSRIKEVAKKLKVDYEVLAYQTYDDDYYLTPGQIEDDFHPFGKNFDWDEFFQNNYIHGWQEFLLLSDNQAELIKAIIEERAEINDYYDKYPDDNAFE